MVNGFGVFLGLEAASGRMGAPLGLAPGGFFCCLAIFSLESKR
jgi:hypothetical protein